MSAAIAAGIYSTLTAHAGLAALVSTRIYPVTFPELAQNENIPNCVVYMLAGSDPEQSFKASDLNRDQWEFTCCASDYVVAHQIADQVRACLDFYKGTWSLKKVVATYSSMADEAFSAAELGIFAVTVNFQIDWN